MRILLGTGTTDANGNVTVTYTGSGAGKVQLMAECGNIQSEPYTLYDVLFKDIGTEDDYTAWSYAGNTTISRESETTITQTSTDAIASMYQTLPITDNFCVEFDVKAVFTETFTLVSFRQGSSSKLTLGANGLLGGSGDWHHIKITVNGLDVSVNRDGTDLTPQTLSDTINRVYLQVGNSATVQYKNFIIYPI